MKGLIPGISALQPVLDEIKARATLTSIAAVLGLVGLFCLAAGLAAALAVWIPWPAALIVTAVAFMSAGAIALWAGLHRDSAAAPVTEEVVDDIADSATAMLTELPVEVVRRLIAERPLASIALFSGFGALLARRPGAAFVLLERLLANFDVDRR